MDDEIKIIKPTGFSLGSNTSFVLHINTELRQCIRKQLYTAQPTK